MSYFSNWSITRRMPGNPDLQQVSQSTGNGLDVGSASEREQGWGAESSAYGLCTSSGELELDWVGGPSLTLRTQPQRLSMTGSLVCKRDCPQFVSIWHLAGVTESPLVWRMTHASGVWCREHCECGSVRAKTKSGGGVLSLQVCWSLFWHGCRREHTLGIRAVDTRRHILATTRTEFVVKLWHWFFSFAQKDSPGLGNLNLTFTKDLFHCCNSSKCI